MKITARKRVCISCEKYHNSSEETCYECRKRNEVRNEIEGLTEQQLLDSLKQLFDESEKEQMEHLQILFSSGIKYLSSDLILEALLERVERDLEGEELEGEWLESANEANAWLTKLHKSWYGW